jgi:acyl-CoA synthetase (AMP-forming)/AMP-acid ligase II
VEDVRVFGKSSSIAGQLVACEIVAQDEENLEALKKRVTKTCLDRLTSYQRPRSISFVEKLSLSSAGKTSRASR